MNLKFITRFTNRQISQKVLFLICFAIYLIPLPLFAGNEADGFKKVVNINGEQREAWVQKITVIDGKPVLPESIQNSHCISTEQSPRPQVTQNCSILAEKTDFGQINQLKDEKNSENLDETRQGATSLYLPDLGVYNFYWKSTTVTEGENFWVEAQVCNYGLGYATGSHVAGFLSVDNDFDISDDYYLGKQSVGGISYNYYESHRWTFTFPNLGSGSYYVWIVIFVDCDNEVAELNENNVWKCNTSFIASDPAGLPDLVLNDFAVKTGTVTEGDAFWIQGRFLNNGTQTAGASQTAVILSLDNDFDVSDDYWIGKQSLPALSPDKYIDRQWDFAFPNLGSGTYPVWVIFYVDCDGQVNESDEANLWKTNDPLAVNDVVINLPDLQASNFWLKGNIATEGEDFWVTTLVNNAGTGSSGASTVAAFLSTDNDFDVSDDYLLGKKSVSALNPGYYETPSWNFTFPNLGSNTYYVWLIAVVDYDNQITESDENNVWKGINSFSAVDATIAEPEISVTPHQLDIYQESARFAPPMEPLENTNLQLNPDLLDNERRTGGTIPNFVIDYWRTHTPDLKKSHTALRSSIDWSIYDSPVKDQGSCGSCWVFAPVALIENIGRQNDLSEQTLLSCVPSTEYFENTCDGGGWMGCTFQYIRDVGVPPESCYPYEAEDGNCNEKCSDPDFLARVTTCNTANGLWGQANNNTVQDIKNELQDGPLCVWLAVPDDGSFHMYDGGIYNYSGGEIPEGSGHFVLVVGYDDADQCFKVKNSWGSDWGSQGYLYIAYDDVTDDVKFGSYACKASGFYLESAKQEKNTIIISNTGNANLQIYGMNSNQDWLTFSPSTLPEIAPEKQAGLTISVDDWQNISAENNTGMLTIQSNDPDEPIVTIQVTVHNNDVSVEKMTTQPEDFWIEQNYPNPFNQRTIISYVLPCPGSVKCEIFDITGRIICEIAPGYVEGGWHTIAWDGVDKHGNQVPSGVYVYRLKVNNETKQRKMLLTR